MGTGSPRKRPKPLSTAIDLSVLSRPPAAARDDMSDQGCADENEESDMLSARRAPSVSSSVILSVDLADALPSQRSQNGSHGPPPLGMDPRSSSYREELSSQNDRIMRNLQVSSILREYGGDTARTDESGKSSFGSEPRSEFSSGYAPRSARAVLRTLEQNDKLVYQLSETQRALDLTKASLAKQKALNRRLEESSNQRRAELEEFSRAFPRTSSSCESAVSDAGTADLLSVSPSQLPLALSVSDTDRVEGNCTEPSHQGGQREEYRGIADAFSNAAAAAERQGEESENPGSVPAVLDEARGALEDTVDAAQTAKEETDEVKELAQDAREDWAPPKSTKKMTAMFVPDVRDPANFVLQFEEQDSYNNTPRLSPSSTVCSGQTPRKFTPRTPRTPRAQLYNPSPFGQNRHAVVRRKKWEGNVDQAAFDDVLAGFFFHVLYASASCPCTSPLVLFSLSLSLSLPLCLVSSLTLLLPFLSPLPPPPWHPRLRLTRMSPGSTGIARVPALFSAGAESNARCGSAASARLVPASTPGQGAPAYMCAVRVCKRACSRYEIWGIPRSVFWHSGVPSINALVRTHLGSDLP